MLGLSSERYAYVVVVSSFCKRVRRSMYVSFLFMFVSLFLALIRCLAVAIEMLRLNVCWNLEVWYVSDVSFIRSDIKFYC
jgi:hypothetical protein